MSTIDRAREDELLQIMRDSLYVAVVSDVLDSLGFLDQAMDHRLRPIEPRMRCAGRAHTVLLMASRKARSIVDDDKKQNSRR